MSEDVRYFVVFFSGINDAGTLEHFQVLYEGKSILFQYLIEDVTEEYCVRNATILGYNEISEQEYKRLKEL